MYAHRKSAASLELPARGKQLIALPGKTMESLAIQDNEPEETPFRGYEDLKSQYFGPTILNKQRLWELGDSLAYQGAYGLPAAAIGGISAGPVGMFGGLALGKLLGQAHLLNKEKERLATAKKYFSKDERKALKAISQKSKNWAIGSALLGGLGVGGLSALAGQDQFGKVWTPLLEGAAAASLAGLGGGLLGQHLARKQLLQNPRFASIIDQYS